MNLTELATGHVTNILNDAIELNNARSLVVYDRNTELAEVLVEAYRAALPSNALFIEFDPEQEAGIREAIDTLSPGDLVILIQSSAFRMNAFRFRLELFNRSLKTIEHVQLQRATKEQYPVYIEALAYDKEWIHAHGHGLKALIDPASRVVVTCKGGTELVYEGGMEPCKLNIGDYREMKNTGGMFPIGEIFTEAKDLKQVNGELMVFGYANEDFNVDIVEPFRLTVVEGVVQDSDDIPDGMKRILKLISDTEQPIVREFGLGLNRAMNKDRIVNDINTFERQYGMHVSLGAKHTTYKKEGLNRKKTRYHIDIFLDIEKITADNTTIFEQGQFVL